ncbi:NAD(P)H-quinone oxidoreductase chain 4 [Medicago truncatula]|uniref:NAD(P)H-quinone oxidoreductase chain 4 n=1 Tax=Medicago truncatula TaxID=3880 RepID=G7J854_MEDTR|nr:NAD(P)H-quinone oxidoreductase chain 4 [Medicago truncatula]
MRLNSCILPLVLHEMGAYGLVRINMELFSHALSIFCPWLMILGSIQIIYADSTSFGQCNLKKKKKRIGSISDIGFNEAVLQIISHGFIGFSLSYRNGRNAITMPKIFTIFTILSMTSLALSGMIGFVAELIVSFFE